MAELMWIELEILECLKLSKNSLSTGVRRIVALTGKRALIDTQKPSNITISPTQFKYSLF